MFRLLEPVRVVVVAILALVLALWSSSCGARYDSCSIVTAYYAGQHVTGTLCVESPLVPMESLPGADDVRSEIRHL